MLAMLAINDLNGECLGAVVYMLGWRFPPRGGIAGETAGSAGPNFSKQISARNLGVPPF